MVKILNIDHGFIGDDVFKNRVTLTVKTDRDAVITCRLYQSGKIVGLIQSRDGTWREYTLADDFKKETLKWIDVHRSLLHTKQTSLFP